MAELSIEDAFRKWSDDLVRYATALVGPTDAADLVADAFTSVIAGGGDRWARVAEPRGYLFRAVANAARMSARSGARRRNRESRWHPGNASGELIGDPAVADALTRLSVQQRAVTFLTYWGDLAPADVASLLDISEGSVKRHLARARSSLREVLS